MFSLNSNTYSVIFNRYKVTIPSWWIKSIAHPDHLMFQRKENTESLDWKCYMKKLKSEELKISNIIKEYFKEENILFDEQEFQILNAPKQITKHKNLKGMFVDGTATYKGEKRIYWEGLFIQNTEKNEVSIFYSVSGILEGGIEGPFFRRSLENIKVL